jgi:vacuolar-type H+-ATPase subunit H
MEELRTTEVLEREILEDARKKAARLLRTTDDTIAQQRRDWEKKLGDDLESIRKSYMSRMKKTVEDIFARQPLDKRRLRLKTHEAFLSGAIEDFLSGLDRTRLISLLERELLERLNAVAGDVGLKAVSENGVAPNVVAANAVANNARIPTVVRYSGISLEETRSILKKSPAAFDWQFQEDLSANDLSFNDEFLNDSLSRSGRFPSIVIDTDRFRLTASIKSAAAALLKDNREELAAALLGREVIND